MEDILLFQNEPNFKLIFIDADIHTRYDRIVKRAENGGDDEKTFEGFLKEEDWEAESRTKDLKKIADFVVDNSLDESKFCESIDEIVSNLLH